MRRRAIPNSVLMLACLAGASSNLRATNYYFIPDSHDVGKGQNLGQSTDVIGYTKQDPDTGDFIGPTSPVIDIYDSGGLNGIVNAYNSTFIDVTGGDGDSSSTISSDTYLYNNANLLMHGNSVLQGALTVYDTASATIDINSNNTLHGTLTAYNDANVTIDNGTFGYVDMQQHTHGIEAHDSSSITINGGTIEYLETYDTSSASVSGGTFLKETDFRGQSTVGLSGGIFQGNVSVWDSAIVTISAGTFSGGVGVSNASGVLNITGGNITDGLTGYGGTINATGGTINNLYVSNANASVTIDGAIITGDVALIYGGTITLTTGTIGGGLSASNLYTSGSATFATLAGTASITGPVSISYGAGLQLSDSATLLNTLTLSGNSTGSANGGATVKGITTLSDNVYFSSNDSTTLNGVQVNGAAYYDLNGGSAGDVAAQDYAGVAMFGGSVKNLSLSVGAAAYLQGGSVTGEVTMADYSFFSIGSGSVSGTLTAHNSSQVQMSGGSIGGDVILADNTYFSISSGSLAGNLTAHDSSDITVEGGSIDGDVTLYDNSDLEWSGGHIQGDLSLHNSSNVNWTGGTLGPNNIGPHAIVADTDSTTTPIYIYDNATIEIDGINLSSTLVNSNDNGFSVYSLSGYFGDGSAVADLQFYVQNSSDGAFTFHQAQQQWTPTAGGSWATASNWLANLVPDAPGAAVTFADSTYIDNPSDEHITMDGDHTLGSLTFNTANNVILDPGTGGTLYVNNPGSNATISVDYGHPQINVLLVFQSDTTINVGDNDDDVRIAPSSAIRPSYYVDDYISLTLNRGLTIATGLMVSKYGYYSLFTPFVRGGNLDIEEGSVQIIPNGTPAGTSRLAGLAIEYGALDLANNDLIIDYAPGDSPAAQIQQYLVTGYDYGYWDGFGIDSSTATADSTLSTALGFADNSELGLLSFDGQSVPLNVILIKYTWVGDANLDGMVDAKDLSMISPTGTTWQTGDFNYDGKVNADDYTLYMLGVAASGGANISTTVPEPSLVVLFSLSALSMRVRRRS